MGRTRIIFATPAHSRSDIEELQQGQLSLIALALAVVSAFGCWWLLPTIRHDWGLFVSFFVLLSAALLTHYLGKRRLRLARLLVVLGPALGLSLALGLSGSPFAAFFSPLAVIAATAISPGHSLLAALANTAALLAFASHGAYLYPALALLWLVAAFEWLSSRAFYTAVQWSEDSQRRASQLLQQLRERHGELNRTLEALTEATRRLQRTNQELDIARREAVEARNVKARFVANISHELRTPLNIIVGFAEMLCTSPESYGDFPWPGALRQDILAIWRNAEHVLKMIDDVLDLAQIEASRLPIVPEPTDLVQLIHDTLATASPLLRDTKLELRRALPKRPVVVNVDRTRIRQVLLNLINNAVRFTPQGYVEVGMTSTAEEAVVYVRDTGEGIPTEKLQLIFQEFEQADSSIRRRHGGAGLGLAISRHFISLHGGRIWAESRVGEGSSFYFALPTPSRGLPQRPLLKTSDRKPRRAELGQGLVTLWCDALALRMLTRYVGDLQLFPANSPDEARTLVHAKHPDAVLVAAGSPDGLALAKDAGQALRKALAPLRVPIVVCHLPTERHIGLEMDVDETLIKPVTQEELVAAVERVCKAPERILIVDDEPDMVRLMAHMVSKRWDSASVVTAGSGSEALENLLPHPDVIVLDLLMPGLSGIEVLKLLRKDPATTNIPVVVVTARAEARSARQVTAGEFDVLRCEGFGANEIMRLLQAVLKTLPARYVHEEAAERDTPEAQPA